MNRSNGIFPLFILSASLLILTPAKSQLIPPPTGNPIVDAPTLKSLVDAYAAARDVSTRKTVFANIAAYLNEDIPGAPITDTPSLRKNIQDNKYLLTALDTVFKIAGIQPAISGYNKPFVTAVSTQASNLLNGSSAMDVLATFIANRFQQELEITYLTRFRDSLANNLLLKTLFPNALVVLTQNDPFQYTTFFESLKEAIEKDIRGLPLDIGNYLALDPFEVGANKYYFPVVLLYQAGAKVAQGQNIYSTLATLDQDPLLSKMTDPASSSLTRLIALLARTLIDPGQTEPTLISLNTVRTNLTDTAQQTAFLGLLLLKEKAALKAIQFNGSDLYTQLNNSNGLSPFIDWVTKMTVSYQGLATSFGKIKTQTNGFKSVPGQLVLSLVSSLLNTVTVTLSIPTTDLNAVFPNADLTSWLKKVTDLSQVAADAADSNYGLALTHIIAVLPDFIDTAKNPNLVQAFNILKTYGNFAVSIAKAKTSADLENALSTAALPIGSYRIKRASYKNISLNAWAGGFLGTQHYPGAVPNSVKRDNQLAGFTAPVGIAYSWGQIYYEDKKNGSKKGQLKGISNTILLNIVDVGSLTAFRLTHDSTATLPDFKWQNVLAPGLFYILGLRNTPLSVGGGVQYGPQLRSITNNTANVLPSAISFRLFLAVDIPIFNFFTRTQAK